MTRPKVEIKGEENTNVVTNKNNTNDSNNNNSFLGSAIFLEIINAMSFATNKALSKEKRKR